MNQGGIINKRDTFVSIALSSISRKYESMPAKQKNKLVALTKKDINFFLKLLRQPSPQGVFELNSSKKMDSEGNFTWDNESSVVKFTEWYSQDICEILFGNGDDKLNLCIEANIVSTRPDILAIRDKYKQRVGAIQIKSPGKGVMENGNVHGQVYAYLQELHYFCGVNNPYVILTTFNQWRIFQLKKCHEQA